MSWSERTYANEKKRESQNRPPHLFSPFLRLPLVHLPYTNAALQLRCRPFGNSLGLLLFFISQPEWFRRGIRYIFVDHHGDRLVPPGVVSGSHLCDLLRVFSDDIIFFKGIGEDVIEFLVIDQTKTARSNRGCFVFMWLRAGALSPPAFMGEQEPILPRRGAVLKERQHAPTANLVLRYGSTGQFGKSWKHIDVRG